MDTRMNGDACRRGICVGLLLMAGLVLTPGGSAQSGTGVVAGTIVDTEGMPVSGLTVVLSPAPGSSTVGTYSRRTDDAGRYRIDATKGRFVLKAGGCGAVSTGGQCPTDAPIYVYHPGTASRDKATVIAVEPGATLQNLNFTLSRSSIAAMQDEGQRLLSMAYDLSRLGNKAPAKTSTWRSMSEMHDYFVASFIATPGMGSGRMGRMMLEVDPAQRLLLPDDEESSSDAARSGSKRQGWAVEQLSLIGIAKHETPVVFTRIGHGTGEGERTLDDVESQAIASLRAGRDIVSRRADGERLLLIGAIRAQSTCLQCHRTEREGALLGALRYTMRHD